MSADGGKHRLGWGTRVGPCYLDLAVQEGYAAQEQEAARGRGWVGPILLILCTQRRSRIR